MEKSNEFAICKEGSFVIISNWKNSIAWFNHSNIKQARPRNWKKLVDESDKRYEAYEAGKVKAVVGEEEYKKYGL